MGAACVLPGWSLSKELLLSCTFVGQVVWRVRLVLLLSKKTSARSEDPLGMTTVYWLRSQAHEPNRWLSSSIAVPWICEGLPLDARRFALTVGKLSYTLLLLTKALNCISLDFGKSTELSM